MTIIFVFFVFFISATRKCKVDTCTSNSHKKHYYMYILYYQSLVYNHVRHLIFLSVGSQKYMYM